MAVKETGVETERKKKKTRFLSQRMKEEDEDRGDRWGEGRKGVGMSSPISLQILLRLGCGGRRKEIMKRRRRKRTKDRYDHSQSITSRSGLYSSSIYCTRLIFIWNFYDLLSGWL